MERRQKHNVKQAVWKALKFACAMILAVFLANSLQLKYAVTAGIITVLSIQNTKKETVKIARNRGLAFVCALAIAFCCYRGLGFHIAAFSLYLFLFAFVCFVAKWPEAIAMNSVLISHFLAEQSFSPQMLANEVLLFLIGVGCGVITNLHLRPREEVFSSLAAQVDEEMKGILYRMSVNLRKSDKHGYTADCFERLEEKLRQAKQAALLNWNNTFRKNPDYEIDYIDMRENQSRVLKDIYQSIMMIQGSPRQTKKVADFLKQVEEQYDRNNDAIALIQQLQNTIEEMRQDELPQDRAEFEARAVTYYLLRQMEELLYLKNRWYNKQKR